MKKSHLKTKTVHGVRSGNHSNPNVLRAARAHGGSCDMEGGDSRPSLMRAARTRRAEGGAVDDNWIAGATENKGALHRALGVPEGETIPAKKLNKAAHSSSPLMRKRAALAKTLKGFKK